MNFKKMFSIEKSEPKKEENDLLKKDLPIEDKKEVFLPIGSSNRYENYIHFNKKDLAEEINKKANFISDQASRLLYELQLDPSKKHFHSEVSGRRWNLHYLQDVKKELHDLYGCDPVHLNDYNKDVNLPKIPNNVIKFLKDFEEYNFNEYKKEVDAQQDK